MGRGVSIALALSLAANVFLGGFVAGKLAGGHGGHDHMRPFSFRHGPSDGFNDLTPAARESLKRAFTARRAEGGDYFREARALHEEFVRVLSADVFDRAAADAIVAKFDAAERTGRNGMAKLIVDAAEGLSAEDRKSLARHLDRRGHGRWNGGRGHRDRHIDGSPSEKGPPAD